MKLFQKYISALLSAALIIMPLSNTQAALVSNDQVINHAQSGNTKSELIRSINRSDIKQQLTAMGVNPADIENRINMMTAEELALLNQHIDKLPAGGDILGVVLVVFIVFVITDVIGATDIFPFIKPVN
jgi:hypothetical protein